MKLTVFSTYSIWCLSAFLRIKKYGLKCQNILKSVWNMTGYIHLLRECHVRDTAHRNTATSLKLPIGIECSSAAADVRC